MGNFPLMVMGGQAEGLGCANPEARTKDPPQHEWNFVELEEIGRRELGFCIKYLKIHFSTIPRIYVFKTHFRMIDSCQNQLPGLHVTRSQCSSSFCFILMYLL